MNKILCKLILFCTVFLSFFLFDPVYLRAAEPVVPSCKGEYIFSYIERGEAVFCLDVEAFPATEEFDDLIFLPRGLATVVFAVDPDQTDLRPSSWQELKDCRLPVDFSSPSCSSNA